MRFNQYHALLECHIMSRSHFPGDSVANHSYNIFTHVTGHPSVFTHYSPIMSPPLPAGSKLLQLEYRPKFYPVYQNFSFGLIVYIRASKFSFLLPLFFCFCHPISVTR